MDIARRCFEWVRDEIKHSGDFKLIPVTCSASEVLREGRGYCYAKSHLFAALLRASGIAAGFCYQRLSQDDEGRRFCLHGLNAVLLPGMGWYRADSRGNRAGIDAQFVPPVEQLAFSRRLIGEADLPEIWPDPLPVVVQALRGHTRADVLGEHLPDLTLWTACAVGSPRVKCVDLLRPVVVPISNRLTSRLDFRPLPRKTARAAPALQAGPMQRSGGTACAQVDGSSFR